MAESSVNPIPSQANGHALATACRGQPKGVRLLLGACGLPIKQQRRALDFRAALERQVEEVHGEVGPAHARAILLAAAAFQEYTRFQGRLADGDKLTPETTCAYSDRRIRNLQLAMKAVESLGLDDDDDPYAFLRQPLPLPAAPPAAPASPTPQGDPQAKDGDRTRPGTNGAISEGVGSE